MKVALFLVALIALSSATSEEDTEFMQEFKRIDSDKFGRYVLDILFMQMKTGKISLDALLDTLSSLEDQYHAEQKEDDATNRLYQSICDTDIANYDKDIHESEATLLSLHGKLEGALYPLREIQSGVVASKKKELARYQSELAEATQERAEENAQYEEKLKEHQEAARIIQEAKNLFEDNLVEQTSFLEKKHNVPAKQSISPQGMAKIKDHFQYQAQMIQKHHKHRKSYASLMQVLATIASRVEVTADQGSIGRIIHLCEDLLTKISNSIDLERHSEDARLKAFQQLTKMIQRNINIIQTILATHEAELAAVQDKIHAAESQQIYVTGRLSDVQDQRDHRYIECQEAAFDYAQERDLRDGRRQLVSDIVGLVSKNLRGLNEQIALRIAAGDKIH